MYTFSASGLCMKVKRLREDFVVEEISDFPISSGDFSVYCLEKSGIGTPEAIAEVLRCWNLPRASISYGGLKDRHASTSQTITIHRGPTQALKQRNFTLAYLGNAPREFRASDIAANHFRIALRNLSSDAARRMLENLGTVAHGFPNYFDDQRFGSLGETGQFVAHPWCLCDYERALFLAIAEANSHDAPREREQKEILRNLWGDWSACKAKLDRSHRRSIVTFLADHPTDFRRAIALVRKDLRSIYVAAFQSQIWNETVGLLWQERLGENNLQVVLGTAGPLYFPKALTPQLADSLSTKSIPLPSARQHQWPEEIRPLLDRVLSRYSLTLNQIRLKYPRDTFFSKGNRAILIKPQKLAGNLAPDELGPSGRVKLCIEFSLDRGCYATMLLKWLESLPHGVSDETLPQARCASE